MAIAIVKPDHLGDLVLSAPAIRAVAARDPDAVLFVGPWNRLAARYLFPAMTIETIAFSHLMKASSGRDAIPDLRGFDCVAVLRNDHVINAEWADLRARDYVAAPARNDIHQSLIDHAVMRHIIGDYDIDGLFYGEGRAAFAAKLDRPARRVGLSVGSGFHANLWPTEHWIALAGALRGAGLEVTVLAGPSDLERARHVAAASGLDRTADVLLGGSDVAQFLERVATLDLVIASDGGGAHLCALVTPILAIFGPSPFRRYAPFGQATRLLRRDVPCSPCCQYATHLVNGCLTMECMAQIAPQDVLVVAGLPIGPDAQPRVQVTANGHQLWSGLSHIGRTQCGYQAGR